MLWYIIIGIVAGAVAGRLTRGEGFGCLVNLIVGIIGGFLGGKIFDFLNIHINDGILANIAMSVVGAVVFLWILSVLRRK
ncbi:MAG: GlsB/YeaQ/YmgE family stress response membrane protein [Flavobacteriaceae bacterium]|jgi:uncharacterized membrane protein YeaQ/YmgE (transglycosylase-associated protein family)|nr:GlsB/YeaQ/YmgE family stress response membrane protein [Flavobacteriaceae bacterium]